MSHSICVNWIHLYTHLRTLRRIFQLLHFSIKYRKYITNFHSLIGFNIYKCENKNKVNILKLTHFVWWNGACIVAMCLFHISLNVIVYTGFNGIKAAIHFLLSIQFGGFKFYFYFLWMLEKWSFFLFLLLSILLFFFFSSWNEIEF